MMNTSSSKISLYSNTIIVERGIIVNDICIVYFISNLQLQERKRKTKIRKKTYSNYKRKEVIKCIIQADLYALNA